MSGPQMLNLTMVAFTSRGTGWERERGCLPSSWASQADNRSTALGKPHGLGLISPIIPHICFSNWILVGYMPTLFTAWGLQSRLHLREIPKWKWGELHDTARRADKRSRRCAHLLSWVRRIPKNSLGVLIRILVWPEMPSCGDITLPAPD